MTKIISVANQKGGVGKTTTAVNLSACIAEKHGKKVLVMDLDPQGNATSGCGVNKKKLETSVYDLLMADELTSDDVRSAIMETKFKNLSILPSTMDLVGAELELTDASKREARIKRITDKLFDYDYVFIDCPPSLGLMTLNALAASDSVLIPIQCEFYALEGLSQLTNTVKQVKKHFNPSLQIEGVLVTMYDGRLNLTSQVLAEVKKFFADKMFKTVIPRNVRISEAPSHGEPINYYDKFAKGATAYYQLAEEFMERQ
ncbi:MAG: ParA family protein [Clostridia bacterium]|nr:ParA family protein [Clostridia bacterium]